MVQIIKERRSPSVAEKFAQAFSGAAQGVAGFLGNQRQNELKQQQEQTRNKQLQELTGMDLSSLPPELQQKAFEYAMQSRNKEQEIGLKGKLDQERDALKFQNAMQKGNPEEEQAQETAQKSFNRMAELIPSLGRGSGIKSFFGGETAEKTGEFTSLSGALEALLVDKVSRGTLSNSRFKYITENLLPTPTDTQAEIKGKLKGLAEILNLDPSALGVDSKKPGGKLTLQEIFK